jgi:DNA-binding response OmpR family regulator
MARILAIEDDPDLAELLAFHLRAAGHEVLTAPDARKGLAALVEFCPDLILLDLMLPDAVGFTVCETIRRAPETAQLPVIFLSACGETETRRLALHSGADDFVTKPYATADLVARIEAQLVIAAHFRRRPSARKLVRV